MLNLWGREVISLDCLTFIPYLQITVNGEFLATYEHRIKPKKVQFIQLAGTAFFSSVRHIQGAYYIADNGFLYR